MKISRKITAAALIMYLLAGALAILPEKTAMAEARDIYQVNGKYTISDTKLVTKCRLETAYSSLQKKTREYKITSKTKIQTVNDSNSSKKTLRGSQRKKMIQKLNKKNQTIQFQAKKGVVTLIWIL